MKSRFFFKEWHDLRLVHSLPLNVESIAIETFLKDSSGRSVDLYCCMPYFHQLAKWLCDDIAKHQCWSYLLPANSIFFVNEASEHSKLCFHNHVKLSMWHGRVNKASMKECCLSHKHSIIYIIVTSCGCSLLGGHLQMVWLQVLDLQSNNLQMSSFLVNHTLKFYLHTEWVAMPYFSIPCLNSISSGGQIYWVHSLVFSPGTVLVLCVTHACTVVVLAHSHSSEGIQLVT